MRQTWNDEEQRVRWRAKQSLDFAFLMEYCRYFGEFYVQMEDDIAVSPRYLTDMVWWLREYFYRRGDWLTLSYYTSESYKDRQEYSPKQFYGFIGHLIRTEDLGKLAAFIRKNYDESPVDWLMADYIMKVVPTRKLYAHSPSLFQHVGLISSLQGKMQLLRAANFDSGSSDEFYLPGIFPSLLPQLNEAKVTLDGQAFLRQSSVVFGMVTSARKEEYLSSTLYLLYSSLSAMEWDHWKLVVLNIHDPPQEHHELNRIRATYRDMIDEEKLIILDLPLEARGISQKVDARDGNVTAIELSPERQLYSLSVAYLMDYCLTFGSFYVHLEDDLAIRQHFLLEVSSILQERSLEPWLALSIFPSGADYVRSEVDSVRSELDSAMREVDPAAFIGVDRNFSEDNSPVSRVDSDNPAMDRDISKENSTISQVVSDSDTAQMVSGIRGVDPGAVRVDSDTAQVVSDTPQVESDTPEFQPRSPLGLIFRDRDLRGWVEYIRKHYRYVKMKTMLRDYSKLIGQPIVAHENCLLQPVGRNTRHSQ